MYFMKFKTRKTMVLEGRMVANLWGDEQRIQGTSGVLAISICLIWVLVIQVCSLHELIWLCNVVCEHFYP